MNSASAGEAPAVHDRVGIGYHRVRRPGPWSAALIGRAPAGAAPW
ncbi:hypothetical protein [Streptantibioticus cattleyicolor]|uniref:Uncharacterized protein n=1 Tax=Streptantibioticus cattleyicolor (strain ATCC 35852 / DSM 46488 / JCM 4925 / NBRC 14057 / NRRL 8057) TaxID=1003195 RepID=G8XGY9_STREN|nr:hypothetical protein [Streptantibioticus cattleyicolor]AEW98816.1 hypothetical protein SCATT_p06230 [Streptantibioticus cattleyicolor NRRL 8057 = DSM 46488]